MVDDDSKYFENFITRKEGRSKWIEYWVVLRGRWMVFYKDKITTNRDNFRGSIELTPDTKWKVAKRQSYNFPFYVMTARGTHLFKCQSNVLRHQWLCAINLASKGVAQIHPPTHTPPTSSALVVEDGEYFFSWDTDKSNGDDDDASVPPGTILVTALPNDLSENTNNNDSDESSTSEAETTSTTGAESTKPQVVHSVPARAITSTGILGVSQLDFKVNKRVASPWSISVERPSSSPQPENSHNLCPAPSVHGSLQFSRHMVRSAPDVQLLSLED